MIVDFAHPLAVHIRHKIVQASHDFGLIESGDRILVCVSGGKDSSVLLASLLEIQKKSPFDFHFEAALLDQKQPGFKVSEFRNWVDSLGVKFHLIERDTYSIVKEKVTDGGVYCSLCSRLRRAILYDFASDHGFNKIALGHHREDLLETALLNLFYSGHLASMPAKLLSDDKRNVLIRPLAYVGEQDIINLMSVWKFPVLPCNLCGSQDGLKRQKMKSLMTELEKTIPGIRASMIKALSQVHPSQLLDQTLWNFKDLKQSSAHCHMQNGSSQGHHSSATNDGHTGSRDQD